jgi:hypothetical protein
MDDREAAFRALYREHYAGVCRYLAGRTAPDRVEDLAAETFLIAWRRLVGEATVRGVPAYELRLDFSVAHMRMSRLIYVSRADYLPLRVVERGPRGEVFTVTDYRDIARLPIDAQTEAQLRMSPHPGVPRLAG